MSSVSAGQKISCDFAKTHIKRVALLFFLMKKALWSYFFHAKLPFQSKFDALKSDSLCVFPKNIYFFDMQIQQMNHKYARTNIKLTSAIHDRIQVLPRKPSEMLIEGTL
jgi:hypothetical protein